MNQLKENSVMVNGITPISTNNLYEVMFTNYPDVVNICELAKMLDIGSTLAYQLVNEGKIPSLKVGRAYKIPKAYLK